MDANPSMAMLGCPSASFSERTDDSSLGQSLTLARCCLQLTHFPEASVMGEEASEAREEAEEDEGSEAASSLFLFLGGSG